MFTTDSGYVWIADPYHQYYPEYVKVLEVLPDKKYKVQVDKSLVVIVVDESQLSSGVLG